MKSRTSSLTLQLIRAAVTPIFASPRTMALYFILLVMYNKATTSPGQKPLLSNCEQGDWSNRQRLETSSFRPCLHRSALSMNKSEFQYAIYALQNLLLCRYKSLIITVLSFSLKKSTTSRHGREGSLPFVKLLHDVAKTIFAPIR